MKSRKDKAVLDGNTMSIRTDKKQIKNNENVINIGNGNGSALYDMGITLTEIKYCLNSIEKLLKTQIHKINRLVNKTK